MKTIDEVIKFTNGTVMVFDNSGSQVPELQGLYDEVKQKVLDASNVNTVFKYADWGDGVSVIMPKQLW